MLPFPSPRSTRIPNLRRLELQRYLSVARVVLDRCNAPGRRLGDSGDEVEVSVSDHALEDPVDKRVPVVRMSQGIVAEKLQPA